jgi:hypothetical protein
MVPKWVLRCDPAYEAGNYYNRYVLEYLRAEALNSASGLVHLLKNGRAVVRSKELKRAFPFSKRFLQPGHDRRPGQSFNGRHVDSHGGGRLPFPDQRDPVARDQLGRERRIPFPAAKREEHFRSMAVTAARLLRGQPVQYALDQLPDSVLSQIGGLRHRDQGRRIHEETPHSPAAGLWVAAPGPRRNTSGEPASC